MASENIVLLELVMSKTELESTNPILHKDQRVKVSGIPFTVRNPTKIGDGATAYSSLPFDNIIRIETDSNYDLTQSFLAVDTNEVEVKNIGSSTISVITGGTNVDIDPQESGKLRRRAGNWELYKNNLASDVDANIVHRNTNITSSTSAHGIKQGSGNGFDADKLDGLDKDEILADTTIYNISDANNVTHSLPDATIAENQQIVKRRGDGNGNVLFSTTSSQTIDGLAASETILEGNSSIILIPKSGNWESVKTGGATSQVDGILGETISALSLVYFDSTGSVMTAGRDKIATSILSGFLTKTGVSGDKRYIQSSGLLSGFSGLTVGSEYFLGLNGAVCLKGSIPSTDYIVSVGVATANDTIDVKIRAPEPTRNQDDGTPIGAVVSFATYKDRSYMGYLPFDLDNAISQANYPLLFAEIGHKYNDAHVAAGDTDLSGSSTLFYPTPPAGYYSRAGIPDSADIDATNDIDITNNYITLSASDYNRFKRFKYNADSYNSVPVFLSGTLPTGLSENTKYWVRFRDDVNYIISLYPTEKDGIENTNIIDITVTATGTFKLTQEGVSFDDSFQGHRMSIHGKIPDGTYPKEVKFHEVDTSAGTDLAAGTIVTDGTNGTPRTSNETRPKTLIEFKYIKAENVMTSGEPLSALRYDTGWVDFWATDIGGLSKDFSHNFNIESSELLYQVSIKDTTTGDILTLESQTRAWEQGTTGSDYIYGSTFVNVDNNTVRWQIATYGLSVLKSDGALQQIKGNTSDFQYRLIITKPNLITTVHDVGNNPKVIDLSSADYTFHLPPITGATQIIDLRWKNGGTYTGALAPDADGAKVDDLDASTWTMEGDGNMCLVSSGSVADGWMVRSYEDSGTTGIWKFNKSKNRKLSLIGITSYTEACNTAFMGGYRGASHSENLPSMVSAVYSCFAVSNDNAGVEGSNGFHIGNTTTSSTGIFVFTTYGLHSSITFNVRYIFDGEW